MRQHYLLVALIAAFPVCALAQQTPLTFEVASGIGSTSSTWICAPSLERRSVNVRWDIQAKMPLGATKEQALAMLRTLLEERFACRVHHETRDLPIHALVETKGDIKVQELLPDTPNSTRMDPALGVMEQVGTLDAIAAAGSFAGLNTPVENRTGLKENTGSPWTRSWSSAHYLRRTIPTPQTGCRRPWRRWATSWNVARFPKTSSWSTT